MQSCKICYDKGFNYNERNTPVKCECVVRKELYAYLTWRYIKVPYEDNISDRLYTSKSSFFRRDASNVSSSAETELRFNSMVKGFLLKNLKNGRTLKHETVTCSTLIEYSFSENGLYTLNLQDNDFVIVKLVNPRKNVILHSILPGVVYNLIDQGKIVWVYYDVKTSNDTFENVYGTQIKSILEDQALFKVFEIKSPK